MGGGAVEGVSHLQNKGWNRGTSILLTYSLCERVSVKENFECFS